MTPKDFAEHMRMKLYLQDRDVEIETFEVDIQSTSKLIELAINLMERNNATGADNFHVEMRMRAE